VAEAADSRKKARRSALRTSAWVVAMPCGKPGYTFSVARWSSLRTGGGGPNRNDLVVVAVRHPNRNVDLFEVFGEVGF